jgi:Trypsin-like peptidase domain
MKKYTLLSFIFLVLSFLTPQVTLAEDALLQSVFKIKTYEYDVLSQSYVFQSYGSAIAISSGRILTNAHVVLDSAGNAPTGYYEICISEVIEKAPKCRDTARLVAYDLVADLALLELDHLDTLRPLPLESSLKPSLWSEVVIYGYPSIGWDTITRTQWKIAGYSAGMYKIDGTIDHGDSGGGAFDHSGVLIGIPTAVASDNGVIGYMIDRARIYKFLQKKTENYETYTTKRTPEFLKLVQSNQKFNTSETLFSFASWTLRLPRNSPFELIGSSINKKNALVTLNFQDTFDRVNVIFQCTRDGSSILGWVSRSQGLSKEYMDYDQWRSVGQFEGKKNQYFVVYDEKTATDDIKFTDTIYYVNNDACYSRIYYYSKKLDAKLVKKAHEFLKNGVTFTKPYILPDSHINPYFTAQSIDSHVRVVEDIDTQGRQSVNLSFNVGDNRWVYGTIAQEKYANRSEFFKGTLGLESYSDSEDWASFFDLVQKNVKHTSIEVFDVPNGRKSIFLLNKNSETGKMRVLFYYPYLFNKNTYAVWFWDYTFNDPKNVDLTYLRKFFSTLTLPGESPFSTVHN